MTERSTTYPRPFAKVLIANRGEIAVRIIRTLRELGIRSVVPFSEPDSCSPAVRLADEAWPLEGRTPAETYLRPEKILDIALQSGCQAIHPGYGFLSERESFAAAVRDAGLTFIGPPPEAIARMGNKTSARLLLRGDDLPLVPGAEEDLTDPSRACELAAEFGYPILLKAAAGGGGKGMRLVHAAEEMDSALRGARSEAGSAFGDPTVYMEKYILQPRHIEVQVLFDEYGQGFYLGERECSLQRRHQKVIEEAPSPLVTPEMRQRMGEAAVAIARKCGYVSAGTVEFIVGADRSFYFLEMNTRLQVEHPVTEQVTGLDLVALQLHVAQGGRLDFVQADLEPRGWSMECRIYAEDPANGFLPSIGKITHYTTPQGPWVRLDSGVESGSDVTVYYDPMLSKLITWGPTRVAAMDRMLRALAEYRIAGVTTNIPFHRWVLAHPLFRAGDVTTHFIADHFSPEALAQDAAREDLVALLGAAAGKVPTPPAEAESAKSDKSLWSTEGRRKGLR